MSNKIRVIKMYIKEHTTYNLQPLYRVEELYTFTTKKSWFTKAEKIDEWRVVRRLIGNGWDDYGIAEFKSQRDAIQFAKNYALKFPPDEVIYETK